MLFTSTYFTANETSPSPQNVVAGAAVINKFGNMAITSFEPVPDDPESKVELVGKPPVLMLCNALANTALGYTAQDGSFVTFDNELATGTWIVNGSYDGPGSQIAFSDQ